jgi:hypothetical protein
LRDGVLRIRILERKVGGEFMSFDQLRIKLQCLAGVLRGFPVKPVCADDGEA